VTTLPATLNKHSKFSNVTLVSGKNQVYTNHRSQLLSISVTFWKFGWNPKSSNNLATASFLTTLGKCILPESDMKPNFGTSLIINLVHVIAQCSQRTEKALTYPARYKKSQINHWSLANSPLQLLHLFSCATAACRWCVNINRLFTGTLLRGAIKSMLDRVFWKRANKVWIFSFKIWRRILSSDRSDYWRATASWPRWSAVIHCWIANKTRTVILSWRTAAVHVDVTRLKSWSVHV